MTRVRIEFIVCARGRSEVDQQVHTLKVAGSIPAPAKISLEVIMSMSSTISASGGKQVTDLKSEVVSRDIDRGEDFTVILRQLSEIVYHLRIITGEYPTEDEL